MDDSRRRGGGPVPADGVGGEHVLQSELGTELEDLLRRLIDRFADGNGTAAEQLPMAVEVEVDGTRYVLLVALQASPHNALSPREHEIARMVAHGLPNKTIAANLGISSWTVSTHLRRMFAKFGVNSRAALVTKILEDELVFHERRVQPS